MEHRKLLARLVLALSFVVSHEHVFAYSLTSHAALTTTTIKTFNAIRASDISTEYQADIIQGSLDEDEHVRPLNHFFDPIHDTGLKPSYAAHMLLVGSASPRWSINTALQANYGYGVA
jgi:hypothetical protein